MSADPRDDPKYRAATEANEKLMRENGEQVHSAEEMARKYHNQEDEEAFRRERMAQFNAKKMALEEMLELTKNARPVDDYQQAVLNAMKTQQTNIILLFGPGHGQTMTLNGPPAEEIVWQEATTPTFEAVTDPLDELRKQRQGIHRYRLNDEMESAQMEECAIYVHHEKCCERRFDKHNTTSSYGRKPYLRGGGIF